MIVKQSLFVLCAVGCLGSFSDHASANDMTVIPPGLNDPVSIFPDASGKVEGVTPRAVKLIKIKSKLTSEKLDEGPDPYLRWLGPSRRPDPNSRQRY
jgi:hypothetical protein